MNEKIPNSKIERSEDSVSRRGFLGLVGGAVASASMPSHLEAIEIPKGQAWREGLKKIFEHVDTEEHEGSSYYVQVTPDELSGWYSFEEFEGVQAHVAASDSIVTTHENTKQYGDALTAYLSDRGVDKENEISFYALHTHPLATLNQYYKELSRNPDGVFYKRFDEGGKIVNPPSEADIGGSLYSETTGPTRELYSALKGAGFSTIEQYYLVADPEFLYLYDRYKSEDDIFYDFPELREEFEQKEELKMQGDELNSFWSDKVSELLYTRLEFLLTKDRSSLARVVQSFPDAGTMPSKMIEILKHPSGFELADLKIFFANTDESTDFTVYSEYYQKLKELNAARSVYSDIVNARPTLNDISMEFIVEVNQHASDAESALELPSWQRLRLEYARLGVMVTALTRAIALADPSSFNIRL